MLSKSILFFTIVIAFWSPVYAADLQNDEIVIIVNSDTVTIASLESELIRIHSANREATAGHEFSLDRLVQKLINDHLLAQEARAIGLDEDSALIGSVHDFRSRLALQSYLQDVIPDTFQASDAEVRAQYAEDYRMFDLQMISVLDTFRAALIADSIRAGFSMDSLALRNSADAYTMRMGHIGWRPLASAPSPIEPYLRTCKPMDIIGPVLMWRMFSVIQVRGIQEADTAELDSLRPVIEDRVLFRKKKAAYDSLTAQLRLKAEIWIDSMEVDRILSDLKTGRETPETRVAKINHTPFLPASTLRREYQFQIAGQPDLGEHFVLYKTLEKQIEDFLWREMAKSNGYFDTQSVVSRTKEFEDSLLTSSYLVDIIAVQATVSDSAVEAYYLANADLFRMPDRVRFASLTRATEDEARQDYQEIMSGTSFEWLARRNSIDEFRDKAGEREWIPENQLPENLRLALDSLDIGGVLPPKENNSGFIIIRLTGRERGEVEPLQNVRSRIQSMLLQQARYQAIDETIRELRRDAKIIVREDVLKALQVTGTME